MTDRPAAAERSARPILVVELDRDIGSTIVEQLSADGYRAMLARTVEHARILAGETPPRIAVLGSLGSPRGTLELLEEIRSAGPHRSRPWERVLPVIVLASHAHPLDTLRAFDAGADDVLTGPVRYLELRARIGAILRRAETATALDSLLAVGPLAIDTCTHAVSLDGRPVGLRRMEFDLLAHLASEPERVFTKEELLRCVWGYGRGSSTRTLDSHASRLRRKLCAVDGRRWVINVWGVGYRLI